jgi:molecular chaperone DnaJ
MKLPGEGEAGYSAGGGSSGPRGDLYIEIRVKPHEIFTREGDDLVCVVPISMVQAALGAQIEVPTLKGTTATLKIPAGTQSGKSLRLKGKGFRSLRGHTTGDEEVRIQVETPAHLTEKQQEILRQFAEISGEKVNPFSTSFAQKVKQLFS